MAEASSPPSMDIDVVVDLHTNATAAAAAAQALLNENSSNASDAGISLKFPVLYTSSSDSETENFNVQRNSLSIVAGGGGSSAASAGSAAATTSTSVEVVRSSSPPPNCAICLGRCKNKCFTDSCVHQFCFKCLCEWSKVKAECPLCKQAFRSIIHNVKAIDQYEEYMVQQPVVQIPHSPLEVTYQGPLNSGFILNGTRRYYNFSMRSWAGQPGQPASVGGRGGPITIRNYVSEEDLSGNSIPSGAAVDNLPTLRSDLLNLYRQELPEEIASTMSLGQLWRRYIYDRKLYALPVSDVTGRYRESSARFYRNNPGQRVRLMPFANRDIVCLLRNTSHDVSTVLESLNEGLEVSNILSRSFRRRLQPYLGERTAHFIHELSNFARSPYDMIGYDQAVQYAPQAADEDHVIEFSSSSEDESNNNRAETENTSSSAVTMNLTTTEGGSSSRQNTQANSTTVRNRNAGTSEFRVQSRSSAQAGVNSPMSLLSFTITTTSEGSETPGLSVAVSAGSRGHAQVAAINLSTHNRAHNEVIIDLDDTVEMNGQSSGDATTSTANSNNTISTASTSANNSNMNTNNATATATATATTSGDAEQNPPVQLGGTIPDRSPQIVASIALTTSSSDECEFVLERKPPHLRTPELVSLNSESDSDVVFVEESKPIMAEATYSTSDNDEQPSLARLIAEQENDQEPSTSKGLRPRTVRKLAESKNRASASPSAEHEENTMNRKRRMRTRRMNTPPEFSTDDSSSEDLDDGNDSEFIIKGGRSRAPRVSAKKRTNRSRKVNTSRRGQKRRKRKTATLKNETISTREIDDRDTNNTHQVSQVNEPESKKRRMSAKRSSVGSTNGSNGRIYGSSTKNASSSDDESSTEEDEKVNLKDLQLRLKKSLSDVEDDDNAKNELYNYSPVYSNPAIYEDLSLESNPDTANSLNSNASSNNSCNNNDDNNIIDDNIVDENTNYEESGEKLKRNSKNIAAQSDASCATAPPPPPPTSPPQRPTTSAAAAAAAAAEAAEKAAAAAVMASMSDYNEHDTHRASFDESNGSYVTSCIASASETQQEQEESQARYHLGSISPVSLSQGSVEPYVPQRLTKDQVMSIAYDDDDDDSGSSLGSNCSLDSYQLPSTSQNQNKHKSSNSPHSAEGKKLRIDEPFNDSGSQNSSASSSTSSTSAWSESEEDRDSDDQPLA